MDRDIADLLTGDDAVRFIAGRHHTLPSELVGRLLRDERLPHLLENEMEILRGLRQQLEAECDPKTEKLNTIILQ